MTAITASKFLLTKCAIFFLMVYKTGIILRNVSPSKKTSHTLKMYNLFFEGLRNRHKSKGFSPLKKTLHTPTVCNLFFAIPQSVQFRIGYI